MRTFARNYGLQRVTEYFNPTQPSVYENIVSGTDSLSATAVIKGDRKNPLPFSYDRTKFRPWEGVKSYYSGLAGRQPSPEFLKTRASGYVGNVGTSYIGPVWDRDYIYNLALNKLNDKVRGGLDLGLSLAESGQTIRMLNAYERFTSWNEDRLRLIQRNLRRKYQDTRRLASMWLEWQYGIRPLISDIYAAHDEAVRVVLNEIKTFKAGHTVPLSAFDGSDSSLGFSAKYHTEVQGKQGCMFSLAYEIPSSRFDLQRWSSLNPVSFAWELTTLSFVVDWFVDVSGYLRNLETALLSQARFKTGFTTELHAYTSTARMSGRNVQYDYAYTGSVAMYRERVRFERKVLSSYPLPRVPSFHAKLGVERLLSAASLLAALGLPKGTYRPPKVTDV